MKLWRYGAPGSGKSGLLDADGAIHDLSAHVDEIAGDVLRDPSALAALDPTDRARVEGRPHPGTCVAGAGKLFCIGLNYCDQAAERGTSLPAEPVVFMKATSATCAPNDDVVIARGLQKTDWEVDLAVIIGKEADYVCEAAAMRHVVGDCVANEVSERAFQAERAGQWIKGKSCATFAPRGPWLVARDEFVDPQNLKMWLDVNGTRRQDGSTAAMVYGVAFLVSYLSPFMTLEAGDVISTGTPPGVGLGMSPPTFLGPGDVVRLGIEGPGEQQQTFVADAA